MQKYSDTVLNRQGKPVVGAVVTVTTYPDNKPATIYAADGGNAVASVTTDSNGRFSFYAADGHYNLNIVGSGFVTQVITDVVLDDPNDEVSRTSLTGADGAKLVGYGSSTVGAALDALIGTDVVDLRYKQLSPKFKAFGGQLRALMKSLSNPFEQFVGITFIGDSITWGKTLLDNGTGTPAAQTLATQRDVFASSSFVNQFKRYIGAQFFDGAAPVLSNWSYSSGGQSTATYSRTLQLYPGQAPFVLNTSGASVTGSDTATSTALLGYRYILADGNTTGTSMIELLINGFTGSEFTLVYTSIATDSTDYELRVDGVLIGQYGTNAGAGSDANQLRRTHTFGYVRNKTISIRLKRTDAVGNKRLHLEAIEIPKKVRITNQGISGTTAINYVAYCFGAYGPTVAPADESYFFVQLGTNDRVATQTNYGLPMGVLSFRKRMSDLIGLLTPATNKVIMMVANPVTTEASGAGQFTMQRVRNVITDLASANNLDLIDNYAAFREFDLPSVLADGLHPNEAGHGIFARNIIRALEAA
jgi:lysophospholipase L1-like esterase